MLGNASDGCRPHASRTRGGNVGDALTSKEGKGKLRGAGRILKHALKAADYDGDGRISNEEFEGLVDYIEYYANLWVRTSHMCLELCRSLLSSHSYVLEAIRRTAIHSLTSDFRCCLRKG